MTPLSAGLSWWRPSPGWYAFAALAEGLKLAEELGFATRNYDNYVGTADLNDKETALHILCHLDVVGEGTGWTVTEPYVPKEVDGMLYGRGTADDKGPMVAALLAMKAIRDNHIPGDKAITCPKCGQDSDRKSVAQNLSVCPKCGYHFPIGAYYRLSTILDPVGRMDGDSLPGAV